MAARDRYGGGGGTAAAAAGIGAMDRTGAGATSGAVGTSAPIGRQQQHQATDPYARGAQVQRVGRSLI